jgi:hypothetical protein
MTKRCASCYRVLDLTQFWRNVTRRDGHQDWCKQCVRAWRYSNREIEREQDRARYARLVADHRLLVGKDIRA